MHVNPFANNANSASSVQQQADVLSTSTNAQFLTELQQVQSPQQFQAMLSNATGQPQPPVSSGEPVSSHHCQGQTQIANLFQPAQSAAF
jgi:hypothetical protein